MFKSYSWHSAANESLHRHRTSLLCTQKATLANLLSAYGVSDGKATQLMLMVLGFVLLFLVSWVFSFLPSNRFLFFFVLFFVFFFFFFFSRG